MRHLCCLLLLHCLLLGYLYLLLCHLLGHILLLLYLVLHNLLLHHLLWLLNNLLSSYLVGCVERLLRDDLGLSLGLGDHLLRLLLQERLGLLLGHVERDVLVHWSSGFLVGEGVHVGLLLGQDVVHNFRNHLLGC